jgi:hypothetical protein
VEVLAVPVALAAVAPAARVVLAVHTAEAAAVDNLIQV